MSIGIVLLSCLISVACGSRDSASSPTQREQGPLGMIQGTVTAAPTVSFNPGPGVLQGASISTVGVPGAVCTLAGTDKSATTDQAVLFTITDVPPGSYLIICKKTAADGTVYAFLKAADVQNGET